MPDLLVKLYSLPPLQPALDRLSADGVLIRRGLAPEKQVVLAWIEQHFSAGWASECDVAFSRQPPTVFVATEKNRLLGFGCHEATLRGFFGPTGVDEAARGRGIGKALLLACLHDQRARGYGYSIIGAAGPVAFYERAVGAIVIPDSWPGVYADLLRD